MEIQKICNPNNVLVSTDSEMIGGFIEKKGLKVYFKRPENLSDDLQALLQLLSMHSIGSRLM